MAAVMAKPKTRPPLFLQAPETSACFQEALRLCRHDSKRSPESADVVIARCNGSRRNDENRSVICSSSPEHDRGGDHSNNNDDDDEAILYPLELRAPHPSFPDATLVQPLLRSSSSSPEAAAEDQQRRNHPFSTTTNNNDDTGSPKTRISGRSVSTETISLPSAAAEAASPGRWSTRRHTVIGGNEEEGAESGAGGGLPLPRLAPPLRVQWADEKEGEGENKHALKEGAESPRRRHHHDRKSSSSSCDSLKSILKQTLTYS